MKNIMNVEDVKVKIKNNTNIPVTQDEVKYYINRYRKKNLRHKLEEIEISIDNDFVDLTYIIAPEKFNRIRRITGYLVGDMDLWNNAKTAEEKDRVKHKIV